MGLIETAKNQELKCKPCKNPTKNPICLMSSSRKLEAKKDNTPNIIKYCKTIGNFSYQNCGFCILYPFSQSGKNPFECYITYI